MVELIDNSDCYSLKRNENGSIEIYRKSHKWDVEFTNLYRNIEREHKVILTHPKHFSYDEDVDYVMFRL